MKHNLVGERIGRWLVISIAPYRGNYKYYNCVCDCGTQREVREQALLRGESLSCGCLQRELNKLRIKHGGRYTRLYHTWKGIKDRCNNTNSSRYKDYGGRGITICDEWNDDFASFRKWAYDNGYDDTLTIERINNDLGYCPSNCRWIPLSEQSRNRRNNHFLTYKGETKTIAEWSEITGISKKSIAYRINCAKWPIEKALTKPVKQYDNTK